MNHSLLRLETYIHLCVLPVLTFCTCCVVFFIGAIELFLHVIVTHFRVYSVIILAIQLNYGNRGHSANICLAAIPRIGWAKNKSYLRKYLGYLLVAI